MRHGIFPISPWALGRFVRLSVGGYSRRGSPVGRGVLGRTLCFFSSVQWFWGAGAVPPSQRRLAPERFFPSRNPTKGGRATAPVPPPSFFRRPAVLARHWARLAHAPGNSGAGFRAGETLAELPPSSLLLPPFFLQCVVLSVVYPPVRRSE